ncbi:hypothetical protein EVAR_62444_1 [Eumeta japonica]|uniref:Uncharacterized protein n=1 Tax=Eumeta variegata TaxID=151549 RepID=A0A4C1Z186_EUMVA|nr:hypothetical protein EVAR_62444_1 [Eumeta japonica]
MGRSIKTNWCTAAEPRGDHESALRWAARLPLRSRSRRIEKVENIHTNVRLRASSPTRNVTIRILITGESADGFLTLSQNKPLARIVEHVEHMRRLGRLTLRAGPRGAGAAETVVTDMTLTSATIGLTCSLRHASSGSIRPK